MCVYVFIQKNETPLHKAAKNDHKNVAELLLKARATIDMTNEVENALTDQS